MKSDQQLPAAHSQWQDLAPFLGYLPEPVRLVIWADEHGSHTEQEALQLAQTLHQQFPAIAYDIRPRRENYAFYPVIGVMNFQNGQETDVGVRIIGLPAGYQLTSLLGAIQAVSFHGQQLEPKTRIRVSKMPAAADIEILTNDQDEIAPKMATICFALAAFSPHIRTFLLMGNDFPELYNRYNVQQLPHTIINGRVHLEGVLDEDHFLHQLVLAVR